MARCIFKKTLDMPVGHSLLTYGRVTLKSEKVWAFAIGFSDEYAEPNTFVEQPEDVYSYELSIVLRRSEQAEAYADMFSKMAAKMKEFEKEEVQNDYS